MVVQLRRWSRRLARIAPLNAFVVAAIRSISTILPSVHVPNVLRKV